MTNTPDAASRTERGVVRSMTGFGRAEVRGDELGVRVEVRSVNARHLKLSCRAPAELDARLHEIEALVREHVDRGTVTLTIALDRKAGAAPSRIDAAVLADYAAQADVAASAAGLPLDASLLPALLRLPGVLTDARSDGPVASTGSSDWQTIHEAVSAGLVALVEMRAREGASLDGVLRAGADAVETLAGAIRARVPEALVEHQRRLRERLDTLLGDESGMPPELVAREAAILSEKTDVAEELERLTSHVAQWRETLDTGGPVGRRLEFLTQELGREVNTIGSKSADPAIRDAVIDLKLEVDRLKEQSANVE